MSNPTPFQIGQQISANFAPAIREQTDYTAIDKIMKQAAEQGDSANFDNLMTEIVKRVSPENRKDALSILEKKKQNILQPRQLESYKTFGFTEEQINALKNLPEAERKEVFNKLYEQNLKKQETQEGLKGALDVVNRQQEIINTGHVGPKTAIFGTARKRGSTSSSEGIKLRNEYSQLGKSLIQYATSIPIKNKPEFETLAEKLFNPNLKKEEAQGIIDAMKRIINNALKETGYEEKLSENNKPTINKEAQNALFKDQDQINFFNSQGKEKPVSKNDSKSIRNSLLEGYAPKGYTAMLSPDGFPLSVPNDKVQELLNNGSIVIYGQ